MYAFTESAASTARGCCLRVATQGQSVRRLCLLGYRDTPASPALAVRVGRRSRHDSSGFGVSGARTVVGLSRWLDFHPPGDVRVTIPGSRPPAMRSRAAGSCALSSRDSRPTIDIDHVRQAGCATRSIRFPLVRTKKYSVPCPSHRTVTPARRRSRPGQNVSIAHPFLQMHRRRAFRHARRCYRREVLVSAPRQDVDNKQDDHYND